MKHLTALLGVLIVASLLMTACSKSQQSSTTTNTEASAASNMEAASPPPSSPVAAALPIPLAKLPSVAVASGSSSAGAKVFSANCASCHGEGGKNGQVGPTLYGVGLKAGQVAYMVMNPQGVDKSSGMPKLPLTKQQIADVSAYVASLK